MAKPIIFVSHIGTEKSIAIALKELIEEAFLKNVVVFVSSDRGSLPLGDEWLATIKQNLNKCVIELVLASPVSLKRSWINFEAGAGWIKNIPVIPICHSGLIPGDLPSPLSTFQAAVATDQTSLKDLLDKIAKCADCNSPSAKCDFSQFITVVEIYEQQTEEREHIREETIASIPKQVGTVGLLPHEIETLVEIANLVESTDGVVYVTDVRNELTYFIPPYRISLAVRMLEREQLVLRKVHYHHEQDDEGRDMLSVTENGWNWLENNQNAVEALDARPTRPASRSDIPF